MTGFGIISHYFSWLWFLIVLFSFPLPICEIINFCFLIQGCDTGKVFDFGKQFDDVGIDIWTLLLYVFSSDFDGIRHIFVVQ